MYRVITVLKRGHVVRTAPNRYTSLDGVPTLPKANYLKKGLVLCGVLLPGETLHEWMERTKKND